MNEAIEINESIGLHTINNTQSNSIIINTDKISIYDRTLDLTIDLSNIDFNTIKSIIINDIAFNIDSVESDNTSISKYDYKAGYQHGYKDALENLLCRIKRFSNSDINSSNNDLINNMDKLIDSLINIKDESNETLD